MKAIFISYAFVLFITIGFLYAAGAMFCSLFKVYCKARWASVFLFFMTGLILTVTFSSIWFTRCSTVNFIFFLAGIPVFVDYLRSRKSNILLKVNRTDYFFSLNSFLILSAVTMIVFCIRFYFYYDSSGIPLLQNTDTLFHSNVSNYLRINGKENVSLDFLNLSHHAHDPYHYFDLWLNAVITSLSTLNSLSLYILVTVSTGLVISFSGLMAITEKILKVNWITGSCCMVFLFFAGLSVPHSDFFLFRNANVFFANLYTYNKLIVLFNFIIVSILFFLYNKNYFAIGALLVIPGIFVSASVSLLPAVFIYILKQYFDDRNKKVLIKYLSLAGAVMFFLLFFYSPGTEGQSLEIKSTGGGIQKLLNLNYLKTGMNICGLTVIQILLIYFPVVFLLILNFGQLRLILNFRNNIFLLFFLTVFFSLLSWAALHYMTDTVQLFSNISITIFNLFCICLILYLWSATDGIKWIITSIVALSILTCDVVASYRVLLVHHTNSDPYLIKTIEVVKNSGFQGAYLLGEKDFSNIFAGNPNFSLAAKHIFFYSNSAFTYSLSSYDAPLQHDYEETSRSLNNTAAFTKFVINQQKCKSFKSISESQIAFIDSFNLSFLVVSANAKPDSLLSSRFKEIITDSITSEKFVILSSH